MQPALKFLSHNEWFIMQQMHNDRTERHLIPQPITHARENIQITHHFKSFAHTTH